MQRLTNFLKGTGGRDFGIKAGLGETTIPKHALSAFYTESKDDETIVDPSGKKLKVIIELRGTHPAPPVPVPTAAQDNAEKRSKSKVCGRAL